MRKLILFSLFLIITSCASMVAPSGGEKDTMAPAFLRSQPFPYTVNFKESKIEIEFNEYFTLQNIKEELLISPQIKNIKTDISKKKLIVTWDDTLLDNNTYTLFFGNSIVDVNESNILEGFTFSFATGNFIDSGFLYGKLNKIDNDIPFENCYVYLCKDSLLDSLSLPLNINYVTKTNKEGNFKFNNLKVDSFYLYCLEDKNKNKKLDIEEFIGFSSSKIYSLDSIETNIINLFPYTNKKNKYTKEPLYTNQFTVAIPLQGNILLDTNSIEIVPTIPYFIDKDSIFVVADSIPFPLNIKHKNTTLYTLDSLKKFNKQYTFKNNKMSWPDSIIHLEFNAPLNYSDLTKLTVIRDSLNITKECAISYSFNYLKIENINCDSCLYKVIIQDSFLNIENWYSSKIEIPIIKKEVNYMEYEIIINSKNIEPKRNILLILESNERTYKENISIDSTQTKIKVYNLRSGNYKVKVIYDSNNNGLWDNGNIENRIESETIQVFPNQLEIKENWDGELILDLNE